MTNVAHLTQQSDTAAAIAFLKQLDPDGWHALCAIHPDTRRVEGRVFGPGEWALMADWIEARQGERNLYYSVNEPDPDAPDSKLKKEHIARIRAVYADIDPKGEDGSPAGLAAERRRIRALMDMLLQDPLHSPTAVVDSGGGMQALWSLPEKLLASEWASWAEAQGRGIAHKVGGDAVQNVERVMRLPGTVNLPDAGKRKKGRRTSVASLVEFNAETHPPRLLEAFAPPAAPSESTTDLSPAIRASMAEIDMGLVHGAFSFDDLPADLRARFNAETARDAELRRVWEGDAEALRGDDGSGSGFRAALARMLRPRGFTVTEFGQLLYVWDHATTGDRDAKLTARTIARDWVRMGRAAAEEEFDAVRIGRGAEGFVAWDDIDPLSEPMTPQVDGWFDLGTLVVGYGAPSVGKTHVFLSMAVSVAAGRPWCGCEARQGGVVYVAAEGGRGLKRRTGAYKKRFGLTALPFWLRSGALDLMRPDGDIKGFIEKVKAIGPVELIVIDTVARVMSGGDENSTKDMSAFVRNCDAIREATGATVLLVHHTGKDTTKGGRGSNALLGAVDTEIVVEPGKVSSTKQRDREHPRPITFGLDTVDLGTDENGRPQAGVVLRHTVASEFEARLTEQEKTLLAAFDDLLLEMEENNDDPESDLETRSAPYKLVREVGSRAGLKKTAFHKTLRTLCGLGFIVKTEAGPYIRGHGPQSRTTAD